MRVGPCFKQTVTATIVCQGGKRFVGTNHCNNAQDYCPRQGMPTGMGYELCRDICQQPAHAEVNALIAAIDAGALVSKMLMGADVYIEGHTYACGPCKGALQGVGISSIIFGAPPAKFDEVESDFGTLDSTLDKFDRRL